MKYLIHPSGVNKVFQESNSYFIVYDLNEQTKYQCSFYTYLFSKIINPSVT